MGQWHTLKTALVLLKGFSRFTSNRDQVVFFHFLLLTLHCEFIIPSRCSQFTVSYDIFTVGLKKPHSGHKEHCAFWTIKRLQCHLSIIYTHKLFDRHGCHDNCQWVRRTQKQCWWKCVSALWLTKKAVSCWSLGNRASSGMQTPR